MLSFKTVVGQLCKLHIIKDERLVVKNGRFHKVPYEFLYALSVGHHDSLRALLTL